MSTCLVLGTLLLSLGGCASAPTKLLIKEEKASHEFCQEEVCYWQGLTHKGEKCVVESRTRNSAETVISLKIQTSQGEVVIADQLNGDSVSTSKRGVSAGEVSASSAYVIRYVGVEDGSDWRLVSVVAEPVKIDERPLQCESLKIAKNTLPKL